MNAETKTIFEEGDTVILREAERNKNYKITPVGKVTHSDEAEPGFCIQWESGEVSADFDRDGKIFGLNWNAVNMNELVMNYGKTNEHLVLAYKIKL